MLVKWVKDVDSGELFPIVEEEANFDIPYHLKICESTVVDYEETTKNTITDLQKQLIAAQEQIYVYKNFQAEELPKEFFEEMQQHRILQHHSTLTEKPKHFAIDKSWILLMVLCIVAILTCFLGVKYFCDNVDFSTVNTSEQTFVQQEAAETYEKTEDSEENRYLLVLKLFAPVISVCGIYLGVRFVFNAMKCT